MTNTFHAKRNSVIYKYLKGETTEEYSTYTVMKGIFKKPKPHFLKSTNHLTIKCVLLLVSTKV